MVKERVPAKVCQYSHWFCSSWKVLYTKNNTSWTKPDISSKYSEEVPIRIDSHSVPVQVKPSFNLDVPFFILPSVSLKLSPRWLSFLFFFCADVHKLCMASLFCMFPAALNHTYQSANIGPDQNILERPTHCFVRFSKTALKYRMQLYSLFIREHLWPVEIHSGP